MKHKKIKFCRLCKSKKLNKIINLGKQPLANNLLINKDINEYKVPLELVFCDYVNCHNFLMTLIQKKCLKNIIGLQVRFVAQNHAKNLNPTSKDFQK